MSKDGGERSSSLYRVNMWSAAVVSLVAITALIHYLPKFVVLFEHESQNVTKIPSFLIGVKPALPEHFP